MICVALHLVPVLMHLDLCVYAIAMILQVTIGWLRR